MKVEVFFVLYLHALHQPSVYLHTDSLGILQYASSEISMIGSLMCITLLVCHLVVHQKNNFTSYFIISVETCLQNTNTS